MFTHHHDDEDDDDHHHQPPNQFMFIEMIYQKRKTNKQTNKYQSDKG